MITKTIKIKSLAFISFCVIILMLISQNCLSQTLYKITWGNLQVGDVTLEAFKKQNELKIPGGFYLDSAIIYFQIKGQHEIAEVNYRPNFDSLSFNKNIARLKPGSYVSFENIRLRNADGAISQPHNNIFYNIIARKKRK